MNTSKKLFIMFIAAIAAVVTFLSGCTDNTANVSEIRRGYYTAGDEAMTVTVVSGVREKNYVADGVAGELNAYTLITVVPSAFDPDAVITFNVTDGTSSYGGTLRSHPFAASFSAEVEAELTGSLAVTINDRAYVLESAVGEDMVSFDKALDAARTELKPEGEYEIRARLIKNPVGEGLCWHVAYYFTDGKQSGILLDPVGLKVLAKKTD